MGSSRLPGKSLMALAGRPLLDHVVERVLAMPKLADACLATSVSEPDSALAAVAAKNRIRLFRGSEWDVLERMRGAARWCAADVVVRVTGDCPFFAPDVGLDVINAFLLGGRDYVWNDTHCSGFPDGTDVEVFTREALEAAADFSKRQTDREHVTPWIRENRRCGLVSNDKNYSSLKLSVDRPVDFELAREMYGVLPPRRLTLKDTIDAYEEVNARRRR